MKITLERNDSSVIVSGNYPDFKTAVEDCVKKNISLERANLNGAYLSGADLSDADLSDADLFKVNLHGANLCRANLFHANLFGAYFSDASLSCANLSVTNLSGANLRGADLFAVNFASANLEGAYLPRANLTDANLSGANLTRADFFNANLSGANLAFANLNQSILYGANLVGAILPDFQICPQGQSFIGYKKLRHGFIATLEIPEDVPRTSSLVGRKCRAQSARILSIEAPDGTLVPEGVSLHDDKFIYRTGEIVSDPGYNPDIRVECTRGVHFFMTKEEARQYQ